LEAHFGQTADVAVVAVAGHGIRGKAHLDGNIAGGARWNLGGKQPVVAARCGASHLSHFAFAPLAAADQAYRGRVARLDVLELTFGKLDSDKPILAIRKIEDGLPLFNN
jgi:hypothetical protein